MNAKRFKNKTVIVTGGAAGIGKSIALEFAAEGARVVIADVQMKKAEAVARGIEKKALFERVPLKEIAQPEWVARGVLFLASDEARYMTGSVLTMDGGYTMDGSLPGAQYWTE